MSKKSQKMYTLSIPGTFYDGENEPLWCSVTFSIPENLASECDEIPSAPKTRLYLQNESTELGSVEDLCHLVIGQCIPVTSPPSYHVPGCSFFVPDDNEDYPLLLAGFRDGLVRSKEQTLSVDAIDQIPIPSPLTKALVKMSTSDRNNVFSWLLSAEVVTEEMLKYHFGYKGEKQCLDY